MVPEISGQDKLSDNRCFIDLDHYVHGGICHQQQIGQLDPIDHSPVEFLKG